jgi:hypothetical protein
MMEPHPMSRPNSAMSKHMSTTGWEDLFPEAQFEVLRHLMFDKHALALASMVCMSMRKAVAQVGSGAHGKDKLEGMMLKVIKRRVMRAAEDSQDLVDYIASTRQILSGSPHLPLSLSFSRQRLSRARAKEQRAREAYLDAVRTCRQAHFWNREPSVKLGDAELWVHNGVHLWESATTDEAVNPLVAACKQAEWEQVKTLVALGINVDADEDDSQSPLGLAAAAGNLEVVEVLLAAGADVNWPLDNLEGDMVCKRTPTALMQSALHCEVDIMSALIREGALLEPMLKRGETALTLACHVATEAEVLPAARLLLEAKAEPNTPNVWYGNPTALQVAQQRHMPLLEALLREHGATDEGNDEGEGEE